MTTFEYTFKTQSDIFASMTYVSDFSLVQIVILILLQGIILCTVFYGMPLYMLLVEESRKRRQDKKRKNLLKQITTQKTLEDQIEQDLKKEETIRT